jgi:hypothetical protein
MAYTYTLQPSDFKGVYYKYSGSSYWQYPGRLYDGDENTAPTKQDGYILIKFGLDWLPEGMVITGACIRYLYDRQSDSMLKAEFRYSNSASAGSSADTLYRADLPNGNWKQKEYHNTFVDFKTLIRRGTITQEDFDAFMNAEYHMIGVSRGMSSTAYELGLDFTYEEANDSKIYAGTNKAKSVYVGETKAKAVYIGTTKVL